MNSVSNSITMHKTFRLRKPSFSMRHVALGGLFAALAVLAGCASVESGTPEEIVKARAEARWKAMVAHDFKRAYEYLAPSYRAVSSFERYNEKINCTVAVRIESQPVGVMNFKGNIVTGDSETWLLEDGKWWLYQKL